MTEYLQIQIPERLIDENGLRLDGRRLDELRRLGVKELVYLGRQKIGSVSVLGKGCVGIVIGARINSRTIALKIRRTDADRNKYET
jgi:hypothetical protein